MFLKPILYPKIICPLNFKCYMTVNCSFQSEFRVKEDPKKDHEAELYPDKTLTYMPKVG